MKLVNRESVEREQIKHKSYENILKRDLNVYI